MKYGRLVFSWRLLKLRFVNFLLENLDLIVNYKLKPILEPLPCFSAQQVVRLERRLHHMKEQVNTLLVFTLSCAYYISFYGYKTLKTLLGR